MADYFSQRFRYLIPPSQIHISQCPNSAAEKPFPKGAFLLISSVSVRQCDNDTTKSSRIPRALPLTMDGINPLFSIKTHTPLAHTSGSHLWLTSLAHISGYLLDVAMMSSC
ncbi:hypothetical protein J6590_081423 [Homalodisca vitripennis]|nr:hypothetical protein J6590_081423 [Homalodisca vitripennis]